MTAFEVVGSFIIQMADSLDISFCFKNFAYGVDLS